MLLEFLRFPERKEKKAAEFLIKKKIFKMNEEYDVIVLGTGLKECILSGLLSSKGKKVLHMDRNSYYGGESASLNITNLWQMYRPGVAPPKEYGPNREWNVDLIPKFVMANGKLVKMLLHTTVTKYLEWKCVDSSFVYQMSKGGLFSNAKAVIHKVPANDSEALKSNLMGLWEKKRCRNFFVYVQDLEVDEPKTWKDLNLGKVEMSEVFKKFKLEENTVDFIGHAIAMHRNDEYLARPALETIKRIKLYMESIGRYGDSPFLYPIYGLGGMPEGFSRYCAIHGGVYMLNKPIEQILVSPEGKAVGVRSEGEEAKAPIVICDPSYVADMSHKVRVVGKVIRCICIMDHPIPSTNNATSLQIIIPQKQTGRKSDIYVNLVSYAHAVCFKGLYIAIVSTTVETDKPEDEI